MSNFDDLTEDAFLGGKVQLLQPKIGYRAGVDPVFLAASVNASAGQSVLDLGCGVGAAALCLGARVPGVKLTGVERQSEYAELARRNGLETVCADLSDLPDVIRQKQFDHVIANPPYFDRNSSVAARDLGREGALGEDTPLLVWMKVAAKRLKPRGYVHFIHRIERLPDLMAAVPSDLGSVQVLPLAPRVGRKAELVILRARKDGRAAFELFSPRILHRGERHERDGDSYMPEIKAVLRDGAALKF
jgi:tRNA1(Val) A37 N6-methylase TrmN6|tara:strand:- start:2080 stop:2817 length:738 start_codon:yes stop_codon:yes gene_type:complete